MFIKELYNYNKALCIAFLLFICAFIFINYKQGAVAAPVYQYGMFSEKFYLKDTQTVYRVFVNQKPADLHKLNFPQRDILVVSPEYYHRSKETNPAVFLSMKNISGRMNSGIFTSPGLFTNTTTDSIFYQWYNATANSILNTQTEIIEIFIQKYVWDNNALKAVSLPVKPL